MSALKCLLSDLFDYAGLFPPAALDMHSSVRNYLEYSCGPLSWMMGRFIVNIDRLPYLWDAAGDYVRTLRLSLLAAADTDWSEVHRILAKGNKVEAIEVGLIGATEIRRIVKEIPAGPELYFEVPWGQQRLPILDSIAEAGARAKVRMGGTKLDAFPSLEAVAEMLTELTGRHLAFKATAGLHHPVRARHAVSDAPGSPTAMMHGFMNFACGAALAYIGGDSTDLMRLLCEEDPVAWRFEEESIAWRSLKWSAGQLETLRREFLIGIGSCSFEEPIRDLEALKCL